MRARTKDGGFVDRPVSTAVITLKRDSCILWVIQDIHERRPGELELITAIETVMKDTNWLSRTAVEKLANASAPGGAAAPVEVQELTRREKEVLCLMCEGADDAAIAKEMGVSRNTLRNHIAPGSTPRLASTAAPMWSYGRASAAFARQCRSGAKFLRR